MFGILYETFMSVFRPTESTILNYPDYIIYHMEEGKLKEIIINK